MARNNVVRRRRAYTRELSDVSFDANAEATVTLPGPRELDGPEDVVAQGYGTGDTDADNGFAVRVKSVGEDANGTTQVTLHAYQGGGAGAPFDDYSGSDIDHVVVQAEGF